MRIILSKGKQKELLELSHRKMTWRQIAVALNLNQEYVRIDVRNERVLLKNKNYKKLCEICERNYDKFIIGQRKENWGKVKGGYSSKKSKIINKPNACKKLSEFIGVMLGDGNIYFKKTNNVGVYAVKIAGNLKDEKEYMIEFLLPLAARLFKTKPKIEIRRKNSEIFLTIYSIELIKILEDLGLKRGNKIKNKQGIPKWIKNNEEFLKACVRGLIDTDGSIFRMSKRDANLLRINFTNNNEHLLKDMRWALVKIGFNPSKIIKNKIYISRQAEVKKYEKIIGFNNPKQIRRFRSFSTAP